MPALHWRSIHSYGILLKKMLSFFINLCYKELCGLQRLSFIIYLVYHLWKKKDFDIFNENLRGTYGERRMTSFFSSISVSWTLYGIRPVRPKAHPDFHPHPPFPNDSMAEDGRREVIVKPRPAKRSFLLQELSREDQEQLKDNKHRSCGKHAGRHSRSTLPGNCERTSGPIRASWRMM